MLSSGNISIHEINGNHKTEIVRQTVNGFAKFCSMNEDNKTVTIDVFKSTFNKPGQLYHIFVEDGFVKEKNTSEPLLGIIKERWVFSTGMY